MAARIPPDVRNSVARIREALGAGVERSSLSYTEIEHALGAREGDLDAILSGRAELGVEHLFGILSVIETDLWECLVRLVLELNGDQLGHHAA